MTDPTPAPATTDGAAAGNADVEALAFDDAFAELQRVVGELESGGGSLESTIARYERAVALQQRCERLLGDAELRVQQLMRQPGGSQALIDVRPDEAAADAAAESTADAGPDD